MSVQYDSKRALSVAAGLDEARVRDFYDWLGAKHDWVEFFESKAKETALCLLQAQPRERILNAGCGTGKDHAGIVAAVGPEGLAVGLDLSQVMASLTRKRTRAPSCRGRVSQFPFADASFDRLICTYVLDVLDRRAQERAAAEFYRVLRPGGRAVVASLGSGLKPPGNYVGDLWRRLYPRAPMAFGGCRPIDLYSLFARAGFRRVLWEPIVQLGVPSDVLVADK